MPCYGQQGPSSHHSCQYDAAAALHNRIYQARCYPCSALLTVIPGFDRWRSARCLGLGLRRNNAERVISGHILDLISIKIWTCSAQPLVRVTGTDLQACRSCTNLLITLAFRPSMHQIRCCLLFSLVL